MQNILRSEDVFFISSPKVRRTKRVDEYC